MELALLSVSAFSPLPMVRTAHVVPALFAHHPPQFVALPLATALASHRVAVPKMGIAAPLATIFATVNRGLVGAVIAVAALAFTWLARVLNTPSRIYDRDQNTVGTEYDAWTSEGILEYYWGEHIHLGYYGEDERKGPFYGGKDFIEAKYDFIDKMLSFGKADAPSKVLDVGCGIGGTSRYIAKKFPQASVTGITISPEQQRRATQLAE